MPRHHRRATRSRRCAARPESPGRCRSARRGGRPRSGSPGRVRQRSPGCRPGGLDEHGSLADRDAVRPFRSCAAADCPFGENSRHRNRRPSLATPMRVACDDADLRRTPHGSGPQPPPSRHAREDLQPPVERQRRVAPGAVASGGRGNDNPGAQRQGKGRTWRRDPGPCNRQTTRTSTDS